jgi:tetratricopeptide (TPR) repeat protein
MRRTTLFMALAAGLVAGGWTPADEPKQAEKPPYQRLLQGDDAKQAAALEKRIRELREKDRYAEAIQAAEELLALRRRVQGADHHEAVDARWGVEALKKVAALPAEQRATYGAAERGGTEARQLERKVRFAQALPLLQRLLEQRRQVLGEAHPDTARSYNNVALNLNAQGKYAEAEPLFRRALGIYRQALSEQHPDTAICYHNVAANLQARGKYAEAGLLYRQALDICRQSLGEDHPDTARGYNGVAYNLQAQGKHAEAEPLYRRALALRRKVLGEDHPDTAQSYNNVAYNLAADGKFAEAEPLYRRALAICQKALGEQHPHTALCYNNVAGNLNLQGKFAEAEPLLRQALSVSRKALGEQHPHTATSYNNLAGNLDDQGKSTEAEPLCRQALDIRRKALGEQHGETAYSYNDLASNLAAQGRHAEAEPLVRKALVIFQQAMGEAHPETARSYNNLATNLHAQGKYAEAEPLYRRALDISRKALGEDHPDTAASYYSVAFNLHAQGQYAEALVALQASTRVYEAARLRLSARNLGRAAFGARQSPWPLLAAALARAGRPAEAWQALESDLARGLLDEAQDRAGAQPPADERRQQQALREQLDQLQPRILPLVRLQEPTAAQRQQLQALLDERAQAERQLAGLAAKQSQRAVAARGRIQARLPADAALVAWVDVRDHGGGVQEHWGCVLRARGDPAWVRLPGGGTDGAWTPDDTALPGRVRETLASPERPAAEVAALCRRLAAQRLEPLAAQLDGVRRLFVVPAQAMAGLPLEALTDRYAISYLPSGTQLVRLAEAPPQKPTATLLALGDPAFVAPGQQHPGEPPALAASRGPGHAELPGTAREVRALAALFEQPTVLLRSDASAQKLEALRSSGGLGQYRYLHFATHGQANRAKAFESALILAQDALPDATRLKEGERYYDGRLTAHEVLASWKLSAELVLCQISIGG